MTLAEELMQVPVGPISFGVARTVTCGSVRLEFNGELSADERRMLEQFAFEDFKGAIGADDC